MERWQEEQRRMDLRFGVLAAALTGTREHPRRPSDFFPSLKPRITDGTEESSINELAAMLGLTGRVLKRKKKP